MTPIDSEHAALLRGIARNTNDQTARKVYADWLQERGNPGWLIVAAYPIVDWLIVHYQGRHKYSSRLVAYSLPWLDGIVLPVHVKYRGVKRSRIKAVLNAYADGRSTPQENDDGTEI